MSNSQVLARCSRALQHGRSLTSCMSAGAQQPSFQQQEWYIRGYSTEASSSDAEAQPTDHKKPYNPDAWRARMPPRVAKPTARLRKENPEAFRRMRIILGYHDLPGNEGKLEQEAPIQQVTISNLQALRYSDLDLEYKKELLSYRIRTLNEGLHKVLEDPDLGLPKPGQKRQATGAEALAGFVPLTKPKAKKAK